MSPRKGEEIPRILLTAPASGSGKTLITCGILEALRERGLEPVAFKCGPDYIDPLFHETVLGTKSRNLDTFFTDEQTTRALLGRNAAGADIAVMEGVMGYYDGLGGVDTRASAYDLARVTRTPAILIVSCRGMSVSVPALIKGFLSFRPDSGIRGVILNRVSGMLYPRLKELIERELGLAVCGYVPQCDEMTLESRHLGLVLPGEVEDLKARVRALARTLEDTLDLDQLLAIARSAPPVEAEDSALPGIAISVPETETGSGKMCPDQMGTTAAKKGPVIAVARDEAFCFLYEDNLDLLRRCGASLTFFSPVHDPCLPQADGLLLCGGYPELYLPQLSGNETMRESIRTAIAGGMPCLAECGGFMYLQREMEDLEGKPWPVVGVIDARSWKTDRLGRFGYITLTAQREGAQLLGEDIGEIRGHEFHYFDSSDCGDAFLAAKPLQSRTWPCMVSTPTMLAGYPHLYYGSNPLVPQRFTDACRAYASREGR